MEEKVINREHINIKPFAKLIVGDPCYFGDKNGENFVMREENIPHSGNRTAGVYFMEEVLGNEEFSVKNFRAIIYSASPDFQDVAEAHSQNGWCPDLCKSKKELGCDSASFDIITDKGNITIHTGSDGCFGEAFHYKYNKVILVDIGVSGDMMSYEQFKAEITSLFDVKRTKTKQAEPVEHAS